MKKWIHPAYTACSYDINAADGVDSLKNIANKLLNSINKLFVDIDSWDAGTKLVIDILPSEYDDWDDDGVELFKLLVKCVDEDNKGKSFDFYLKPADSTDADDVVELRHQKYMNQNEEDGETEQEYKDRFYNKLYDVADTLLQKFEYAPGQPYSGSVADVRISRN